MAFRVRVMAGLLRLGSWLPLRALHALGAALGWLVLALGTREARVARRNLELAFPELDTDARAELLRATLSETGKGITELAHLWRADATRTLELIRAVHGAEHLVRAEAAGRGVIVAAPHLGAWELLNLHLSARAAFSLLYRVPQHAEFEALLTCKRTALGAEAIRADAAGVRQLFRRLKEGRTLGILPDQRPKGGEGEEGAFFGRPTMTMTLLSRLAHKTGAAVVFAFAERLPRASGYALHFLPAEASVAAADPKLAVAALNRGLEACVRVAPAQYQWTYKRFGFWKPGDAPEQVYAGIR
jgi:KDO2-lipid IV(A) lauroyltransferase